MKRAWNLLALGAFGVLAVAAPAGAGEVGAGVGAVTLGPIKAVPVGKSVPLVPLYVANTGTVATTYSIAIDPAPKATGFKSLPASWVVFGSRLVTLPASKSTYVAASVKVPKGTRDGNYRSFVTVRSVGGDGNQGALVGAAAATDVVVRVKNGKLGTAK